MWGQDGVNLPFIVSGIHCVVDILWGVSIQYIHCTVRILMPVAVWRQDDVEIPFIVNSMPMAFIVCVVDILWGQKLYIGGNEKDTHIPGVQPLPSDLLLSTGAGQQNCDGLVGFRLHVQHRPDLQALPRKRTPTLYVDKMFILSNMTLLIHYSSYAVREIFFKWFPQWVPSMVLLAFHHCWGLLQHVHHGHTPAGSTRCC